MQDHPEVDLLLDRDHGDEGIQSVLRNHVGLVSVMVLLGNVCMGNKKIPTHTKTYHGDVHLREGDQIHIPF